ncbi:MAG TPA: hypothetical protein VGJ83_07005 [Gemmatimonadales bacterium]
MRKLPFFLVALAGIALACSETGGVDADAIDSREMAAVRSALDSTVAGDTLYPTLAALVFPFIDRASRVPTGSDTTRLVGIELDIDAVADSTPLVVNFTAILGWRGYDSTTRTVDTVFFILGAGRAPVNDSLKTRFAPDTARTGTGFVIHQAADSSVTGWLARGGHLRTTAASYAGGHTQSGGGLTLTTYRGMLNGEFTITAKQIPDSLVSTVSSGKDFGSGARALKVKIRGTLR